METLNLNLIKKKRISKRLSNQDMANALGFKNASTYFKYENGYYKFKLEMLPTLSRTLGIDYRYFFNKNSSKTEHIRLQGKEKEYGRITTHI